MAMELKKNCWVWIRVPIGCFLTPLRVAPLTSLNKQKILLTRQSSKSSAFWGVQGLPPGHFSEVTKGHHGSWLVL